MDACRSRGTPAPGVVHAVRAAVGTPLTAPIGTLCAEEPTTTVKLARGGPRVIGMIGRPMASRAPA